MKTKCGEFANNLYIFPVSGEPKSNLTLTQVLKHREKHGTSIMYFDVEMLAIPPTEEVFKDILNVDN